MAVYLYAVCRSGRDVPRGVPTVGGEGDELMMVGREDVAVICSPLAEEHVRMTPDNLEAHQLVVEEAARGGVVLPFRFGMAVPSEDDLLENYLVPRQEQLTRALDSLDGLVELRIVGRYQGDVAVADVVRADAQIRRLHKRISERPAAATYYDRIQLGEQVMAGLERIRERDTAMYATRLRPHVVAHRSLPLGGEEVAFRSAYLVDRRHVKTFEDELSALADQHRERLEVTLVGPLAPWDFAEIDGLDGEGDRGRPAAGDRGARGTRRGRGRSGDGRSAGAAWAS